MSCVTVYQDGDSLPVQRTAAAFGALLYRLPLSQPSAAAAAAAAASAAASQPSSPSSFETVSESSRSGVLFNRLTDNYAAMLQVPIKKVRQNRKSLIFMLQHAFDAAAASDVVVLEEDLEVSPDFAVFFAGAISMLHSHTSRFFCASSYNDNAFTGIALNNSALRLGQHFMALGWAVTRQQFDRHIRRRWNAGDIWDAPFVKAVMSGAGPCIFPEVARSKHHADPDLAQPALTTSAVFQRAVLDEIQLAPAPSPANRRTVDSNAAFCWHCVLPEAYTASLLQRMARSVPVRIPWLCDAARAHGGCPRAPLPMRPS